MYCRQLQQNMFILPHAFVLLGQNLFYLISYDTNVNGTNIFFYSLTHYKNTSNIQVHGDISDYNS